MPDPHLDPTIARGYDSSVGERNAPEVLEPTVEVLAEFAGGGAVLEFAVGTGRVALPLSRRGVPVHGIDLSPAMLDQLRAKPGAEAIALSTGDVATARVEGRFSLVYLVFNTIMNLTTQDQQVDCFANASAHLEPGGCFVVETMVPAQRVLPPGETVRAFDLRPIHLGFDEYTDLPGQILRSHHVHVGDDGTANHHVASFRYVWPSELDLMARLAGMTLRHRWADWDRSPFTGDSPQHVSVWQKR